MELLDTLGIGTVTEAADDDRGTVVLELDEKFEWPEELKFPSL